MTSPASTPAWIAAPMATTSSGLTPLCGSLPKSSLTICWTFGMRVEPPTSTTSSIFESSTPASASACLVGPTVSLQQIVDELLELRARELQLQVLRPGLVGGDEREVDVGLHHGGELHLGLLRRFLQALQRHPVLAQIDAFALLELAS